jgi:hypothetical protein
MNFKVGDVIRTKSMPQTLGIVVDRIFIESTDKLILKIFFEDSDEPEWQYKNDFYLIFSKKDSLYIKNIYSQWEADNNVSGD